MNSSGPGKLDPLESEPESSSNSSNIVACSRGPRPRILCSVPILTGSFSRFFVSDEASPFAGTPHGR